MIFFPQTAFYVRKWFFLFEYEVLLFCIFDESFSIYNGIMLSFTWHNKLFIVKTYHER